MESFRTVFRLVVMLIVIGIGFKAWQHYGPPADQLKSLALRALEVARASLESETSGGGSATSLTADPRPTAPMFDPPTLASLSPPASPGPVMQAQALVPSNDFPASAPITPPELVQPPSRLPPLETSPVAVPEEATEVAAGADAQFAELYSQLEQLGGHHPQLAKWGNDGQLHRFSCQASLAGAENFNRHFEAVAAEPQVAVEKVVAEVAAWRGAQGEMARRESTLR